MKPRRTTGDSGPGAPASRSRNPERSKRAILDAALVEFSERGHAGARVDRISERAGVSKPMIYSYFGDKDEIYFAALREAYVQIRSGEMKLELGDKSPEEAIRALVDFSFDHVRSKPWFVSILNTENLRGGSTIEKIQDASEIQSPLIAQLRDVLDRGVEEGSFRSGVDAIDLYITIAALCYFPVSNIHTLRAVFRVALDDEEFEARSRNAAEMIIRFLRPDR